MKKKIRVGITGINPFNGNRGVGALAISTIFCLNKIAKEDNCMFEITTINSNYGRYTICIGQDELQYDSILPTSFFSFKEVIKIIISPKHFISYLKYLKLDYILCVGEGDSFSDIYGKQRFHKINSQCKMASLHNKKYVLLPQTIGPFKDEKIKRQANKSIKKSELVFPRDQQSFEYVTKSANSNEIYESIDVAFFMPYERQVFSNDYIHVGLNISSLLWHGGYTKNNQFGLKSDYPEFTHSIIDYFLTIPNVKIHIVPHVVLPDSNVENDYEVSYELVKQYNNEKIILAPFFLDPISAKSYIAGLDFFAGARMHATIAAFSSGVPVFPLAYSRKFNGLFCDTLNYDALGDMVNEEMEVVLEKVTQAFERRSELATIIQSRLNTVVKEREKQLMEKLSEVLQRG